MKKQLQFTLGAIFFALLLVYGGTRFYRSFAPLGMDSDPGWIARRVGPSVRVVGLRSVEPAGLLRLGDEVLALDGEQINRPSDISDVFHQIEPGRPYTVLIRRNGFPVEITLVSQPIPLIIWVITGALYLVIPNIFLLTGLIVFMLKAHDKKALLLALMFGMFTGALFAIDPNYAGETPLMIGILLTVHLASLFLWPIFFHFFQIFPEPSVLLQRVPRLEGYLYLPQLLTIFPYFTLLNILAAFSPNDEPAFRVPAITLICIAVAVAYIVGGLLSLLFNYRQAGRASRRKMRVVVAGSIAGFLPMIITIGLAILFNLPEKYPRLGQRLVVASLLAFPLFPLSFAYAIVRHQVIPVRLILRRGVRYLLVSRGFIIIQAIVVFAVLSYLLTGSRLSFIDSFGERADIVVTMAATAVAIGMLTIVNQRVLPLIDRRFFREAYDAQQLLSDLGMEMRKVANVRQLLELAVSKVQDALHIENATVFLRERPGGDYKCALSSYLSQDGASITDSNNGLMLSPNSQTIKRMRQSSLPLIVYDEKARTWGQGLQGAKTSVDESRQRERATLRRVNSV